MTDTTATNGTRAAAHTNTHTADRVLSYLDAGREHCEPMDDATVERFIRATCREQSETGRPSLLTRQEAELWGDIGRVFWDRISIVPEVQISVPCAIFCCLLSDGRPGDVVMWAYTINRLFRRTRQRVTMTTLAKAFPMGFPTRERRLALWDEQKCHRHGVVGDNMVDRLSTWMLD